MLFSMHIIEQHWEAGYEAITVLPFQCILYSDVDPPNEGHFGDSIYKLKLQGMANFGPGAVSFVVRFNLQRPFLGERFYCTQLSFSYEVEYL